MRHCQKNRSLKIPIPISYRWPKSATLVFHGYLTNFLKPSSLKHHTFIICFHESGFQAWLSWIFCFGCHRAVIKVSIGMHFHLENQLGKNSVPSSLRMLAEFISLQLFDWWSQCFSGCWLEATLRFHRPPTVPRGHQQFLGHIAFSNMATYFMKASRRVSFYVFWNYLWEREGTH